MIAIAILVYFQSTYLFDFVYSIYCICIGNTDVSTWPVTMELSVPFDMETIFGWYLLLLCGISVDSAYFTCLLLGTSQFIGLCIYIAAICDQFDFVMQTVQKNVNRNLQEENAQKFDETNREANVQIRKAIQIQVKIHE